MQDVTDPVVQYDQLADRWMVGYVAFDIFVQNEFHICMAVSQTGDAPAPTTGTTSRTGRTFRTTRSGESGRMRTT